MIKSALPYLTFDGNCDEALSFYEEIFEAKVVEKALASEYNIETKKILRGELEELTDETSSRIFNQFLENK